MYHTDPWGKCPGGKCPGGNCPGGICHWGKCPGGTCPGGGLSGQFLLWIKGILISRWLSLCLLILHMIIVACYVIISAYLSNTYHMAT